MMETTFHCNRIQSLLCSFFLPGHIVYMSSLLCNWSFSFPPGTCQIARGPTWLHRPPEYTGEQVFLHESISKRRRRKNLKLSKAHVTLMRNHRNSVIQRKYCYYIPPICFYLNDFESTLLPPHLSLQAASLM